MSPCSPPGSLQEGRECPAEGMFVPRAALLGAAGAAVVSPVDASQVPAGLRAAVIKLRHLSGKEHDAVMLMERFPAHPAGTGPSYTTGETQPNPAGGTSGTTWPYSKH